MIRHIFPSSYECECGHLLHFFERTIWEMQNGTRRSRARLGEGGDRHCVIFERGQWVAIYCPKKKAEISAEGAEGYVAPRPAGRRKTTLSERQTRVLAFIDRYIKENGKSPSNGDVGREFGVHPRSIHKTIVVLRERGYISREPWKARSILVLKLPEGLEDLKSE